MSERALTGRSACHKLTTLNRAEPMSNDSGRPPAPEPKRPYATPELRVFGTVTALTAEASMSGKLRDGGPNNLKT
jgi:hypothetical protein